MYIRYCCECGREVEQWYAKPKAARDQIPVRIRCACGGEMVKQVPRVRNHYHPSRGKSGKRNG